MTKNIIVVGGGASGLMAAIRAGSLGYNVKVFEQNEKIGKKLYITGKGRCNITNDCDEEEFFQNVISNPKFLMSAIYSFPPQKTMEFFENNGLRLKVERGNRVFPESDKSNDVIKCLYNLCDKYRVHIHTNEKVEKIEVENQEVVGVVTAKAKYKADRIIIATGGATYSMTGSTGDGYEFAKCFNHTVTPIRAGLSAVEIEGSFCERLMGLSLKNVSLRAECNGKTISDEFGEMVFTHFGVSGPIVLTMSSKINKFIEKGVKFYLDLKPALDFKQLDNRVLRDFAELGNKQLKNSLYLLMPRSLVPEVIEKANLDGEKPTSVLTKEERERLVYTIKNFEMKVIGLAPLDEAIITSGGVSVREINPKNMESKIIKGLRFCGEVVDVDALTGGFNLQIAFATGYLAGGED